MIITTKEQWQPTIGIELDNESRKAILTEKNVLVIAGPGTGKTELLAQKACFLLATDNCRYPRKILAISYKKDAANNLQKRVIERLGAEANDRFVSLTIDSFAKGILDQFRLALPTNIMPNADYDIVYKENEADGRKYISFYQIKKLACYIIKTNPKIKKALQITYSHLFIDEFQDTTELQYDLINNIFMNSTSLVTAVGDNKQRIMTWAGAKPDIFDSFIEDFDAETEYLMINHRSAPKLIELQKSMYKLLHEDMSDVKHSKKWGSNEGDVILLLTQNDLDERKWLVESIVKHIENGIKPNDICILCKQKENLYTDNLIQNLTNIGITARIEKDYQEILQEPLINFLLAFFKLAVTPKGLPDEWNYVFYESCAIKKIDLLSIEKDRYYQEEYILSTMLDKCSNIMKNSVHKNSLEEIIQTIIDFYKNQQQKSYFETRWNNRLEEHLSNFIALFEKELKITNYDWLKAIDNFMGANSIPIMTIHKSKSLEYSVVYIIGLEDSAFWQFENQSDEDKRIFFVALSRAKQYLVITSCDYRANFCRPCQSREKIKVFFDLLLSSETVKEIRYPE